MSHPPFGRQHKPTLGKSRIWLGSLRRWDLGLMPFGWPVGDTKQYPLKPPSSDCAGGGVRTGDLAVLRSHDSSPLEGRYHYAILPPIFDNLPHTFLTFARVLSTFSLAGRGTSASSS